MSARLRLLLRLQLPRLPRLWLRLQLWLWLWLWPRLPPPAVQLCVWATRAVSTNSTLPAALRLFPLFTPPDCRHCRSQPPSPTSLPPTPSSNFRVWQQLFKHHSKCFASCGATPNAAEAGVSLFASTKSSSLSRIAKYLHNKKRRTRTRGTTIRPTTFALCKAIKLRNSNAAQNEAKLQFLSCVNCFRFAF